MEKVLEVYKEDQASHNFPLSQSLTQSKLLTLFNSMEAERGEEAAEEKFGPSRGCFMRFNERGHLHNRKVQGGAASADTEASAGHPEDLAKKIDEGVYTKRQIFNVDRTALYWSKTLSRTFIPREMSIPSLKSSKGRMTLLLGDSAAGDFNLKPMLTYHFKNPRTPKNDTKSTLPVPYKWNNAWMTAHLFTGWFTEYCKPTVETYYSGEEISFKILVLIDNAPGHQRTLMELYKEIDVVFTPANTTPILQPMDQGVVLTFKSYLRNTFHVVIAAIASDSSVGHWKNKLKTFWKGFTILDAIKNIHHSWEEVKISTLTGVWKELIPTLMGDYEGFPTLVEKVTTDGVKKARELELEVDFEDVTKLLQSHDKTLMDEELLLMDDRRKWFLEMESTPDEDTVSIVEMTTKNLEYYINLIDKVVAGFERID
ncbi:tigger transposable element-derived protein 1-like [Loxodonta africana]|uniref:tigger transposable element-derived protein 1-like n=1 Tax=Loxodonta africana TaxID=9785 RepID=UPI0030CB7629